MALTFEGGDFRGWGLGGGLEEIEGTGGAGGRLIMNFKAAAQ